MVAERAGRLSVLAQSMTNSGSTFGLITALILAVGVLRMLNGRWAANLRLAVTMAVSVSLTTVLKLATAGARPTADVVLGVPASSFTFPSGHTLNSTTFFLLAAALLPHTWPRRVALWLGAAVTVALIGWSRVYLGYHWPTDVVPGWLLGLSVVCVSVTVGRGWLAPHHGETRVNPVTRESAEG